MLNFRVIIRFITFITEKPRSLAFHFENSFQHSARDTASVDKISFPFEGDFSF